MATAPGPAAWRSVYLAGILDLFHGQDVVSAGNSTPEVARSWATPCDDSFLIACFSSRRVAGNSHLFVAQGVAGKPGLFLPGRKL